MRGLAKELIDGANANGLNETKFCENSDEAAEFLANEITSGEFVLVKGSRGVRTEKVIEKLLEKF